ncbi:hypothetical protein [Rhodoferax sp. PAMC 29310]|uniref:hypothetical protein n=1 Tax=Rhodoferax sp. PAMC 29310 TaxID=2822760 RepID=UPI001B3287E7|nr:hypothetical protein [Rhodoferax sp. PAMC 29310]
MTIASSTLRQLTLVALTTLACAAYAQTAFPAAATQAQARYQRDMAVCNSGQSNQSVATCRREAASALDEAQRGTTGSNPAQYQNNALQRCAVHQGDDRVVCEARITNESDITSGVQAGGVLRQSTTVTPEQ